MARFVKIERSDCPGSYTNPIETLADVIDSELDGSDAGVAITLTVVEMTQEDYDKLPEFNGW